MSAIDKLLQLFSSPLPSNWELGLQLAQANAISLEPLAQGIKQLLALGESRPNLQQWEGASFEQLLPACRQIYAMSIEEEALLELPAVIAIFQRLGILELHALGLQTLPESLGQLQALRSLGLKNNQLQQLPQSMGELKGLKTLLLPNNQLRELPESMRYMSALQTLDLAENPYLLELPAWLAKLPNLKTLALDPSVFAYQLPVNLAHLPARVGLRWGRLSSKFEF